MPEQGERIGPLSFYVAGHFQEKEKIRGLMEKIRQKGHQINVDWTTHFPVTPYENNPEIATAYIEEDLEGARTCDIFVLVPEAEGGTTQFAELGIAIMSERVRRIFVVGPNNRRSMSFFHPRVERVDSIEEVFKKIEYRSQLS